MKIEVYDIDNDEYILIDEGDIISASKIDDKCSIEINNVLINISYSSYQKIIEHSLNS
jgi:hypothetical protein